MLSSESADSVARCSLTGFQKTTSATQFLSSAGPKAMLSAQDANRTPPLRDTDGDDEAPLPTVLSIAVREASVSSPVSVLARTTLLTPLPPVGTRSVAPVRKATRSPLS